MLAAVLLHASGCSTWHTEPGVNRGAVVANHQPSRIRLQLRSGERLELRNPALHHDTLIGLVGRDSVRVPVADVAAVADRRFSAGRTAATVGLSVGALFGLALVACAADPCGY